jgi:hypothetical protein
MVYLGPLHGRIDELENVYGRAKERGASFAELESYQDEARRLLEEICRQAIATGQPEEFDETLRRHRWLSQPVLPSGVIRDGEVITPSSTKPTPKTVLASSSPNASPKPSSVRKKSVSSFVHLGGVLMACGAGPGFFLGWILLGTPPILAFFIAMAIGTVTTIACEVHQLRRPRRETAAIIEASIRAIETPTYRQTLGTTYFEPYTDCPACGTEALHWIESPAYDSEFADFDMVRTCRAEDADGKVCGHRWGQNALGIAPKQPIQGCIDPKTIGKIEVGPILEPGGLYPYSGRCQLCCKEISWIGNHNIPPYLPYCSVECFEESGESASRQELRNATWDQFRQDKLAADREETIRKAFDEVHTQDATDVCNAILATHHLIAPAVAPATYIPFDKRDDDDMRLFL